MQKYTYSFSAEKNHQLIKERRISFEEIIAVIELGYVLDIVEHPNAEKYEHQKIYIVEFNHYAYLISSVKNSDNEIFLKTIIPSRKPAKLYLKEQ